MHVNLIWLQGYDAELLLFFVIWLSPFSIVYVKYEYENYPNLNNERMVDMQIFSLFPAYTKEGNSPFQLNILAVNSDSTCGNTLNSAFCQGTILMI